MKAIAFAGLALCLMANGAETKKRWEDLTPDEKEARNIARREAMMRKSGGFVEKKGVGTIVFVNGQELIPEATVGECVDKIHRVLKYGCELRRGGWTLNAPLPEGASAAVYIVCDESLPMSLVSVEARWGVVNTKKLKLGSRFSKELTRVFALVAGGGVTQMTTSPLRPVFRETDLDKLPTDGFTIDIAGSITTNLKALGLQPSIKTTYKKACQEGWASQPTNEYQKAVWEQVHSIPTKPLKIEFDPKTDRK